MVHLSTVRTNSSGCMVQVSTDDCSPSRTPRQSSRLPRAISTARASMLNDKVFPAAVRNTEPEEYWCEEGGEGGRGGDLRSD